MSQQLQFYMLLQLKHLKKQLEKKKQKIKIKIKWRLLKYFIIAQVVNSKII